MLLVLEHFLAPRTAEPLSTAPETCARCHEISPLGPNAGIAGREGSSPALEIDPSPSGEGRGTCRQGGDEPMRKSTEGEAVAASVTARITHRAGRASACGILGGDARRAEGRDRPPQWNH